MLHLISVTPSVSDLLCIHKSIASSLFARSYTRHTQISLFTFIFLLIWSSIFSFDHLCASMNAYWLLFVPFGDHVLTCHCSGAIVFLFCFGCPLPLCRFHIYTRCIPIFPFEACCSASYIYSHNVSHSSHSDFLWAHVCEENPLSACLGFFCLWICVWQMILKILWFSMCTYIPLWWLWCAYRHCFSFICVY